MRLEDLQGRRFGRYEITGLLGRGGMAAVYRAHDTALRRDVALKVLYPQYAGDTALVERFQREAVLAANLDHPNILPIYDVGETDGLVYIAMRLLNGSSFADVLRMRGSLPAAELVPIVDQIAAALDYAHARQIVHRDIKPANILIEGETGIGSPQSSVSNAHAVLTDFGIAKSLDPLATGLTVTGVLIGTPEYMAPEQIRGGQSVDARADIYALGVLVYRALTGRRPFEGSTQEVLIGHLQGDAPDPSSIEPSLPQAIDAVVRKALARNPDARYHSAGEFARALRGAAGLGLPTPPPAMRRESDGRAVVPRVAVNQLPRTSTNIADQATRKGTIVPPGPRAAQPARPAPSRVATPPAERSGGGAAWAILGLVLALVIGGGLLYASGLITGNRGNGSGLVATASSSETVAATEAPSAAPTDLPTAGATAAPAPSAAPTDIPATGIPQPTTAPTKAPTARPPATATSTPSPTPTPSPTVTPAATATETPTVSPSPIPLQGGFKLLLEQNEGLARDLGRALKPEKGGADTATEQQYENGSMFYFRPDERIYVLFGRDMGNWNAFEQSELEKLPVPPPANCDAPQQGGFALIWGNNPKIQQQLGCSTAPEPNLFESALQPFENGTLLYSQKGLGRGKTIYVLWAAGTFDRYDDPNQ